MRIILSLLYAPIIFFLLKYFNYTLEESSLLKAIPFLISCFVTILMIYSYIEKKSIILYFAKKFTKHKIEEDEKRYIHASTLFWIVISMINAIIHWIIFINIANEIFWIFYSSVGWYLLFIGAGILQYLHKRLVFLKRKTIEA